MLAERACAAGLLRCFLEMCICVLRQHDNTQAAVNMFLSTTRHARNINIYLRLLRTMASSRCQRSRAAIQVQTLSNLLSVPLTTRLRLFVCLLFCLFTWVPGVVDLGMVFCLSMFLVSWFAPLLVFQESIDRPCNVPIGCHRFSLLPTAAYSLSCLPCVCVSFKVCEAATCRVQGDV